MQTAHRHANLSHIYGIIIAVISIALTTVFYLTDTSGNLWTGYFVYAIMFLGVLFSIIHYNRQHHEKTSMMAMFGMGFRTTIWATVIVSAFTLVFHFMQQSSIEDHNFWIYLVTNVLFANIILGLLASLIGAMAFKKNQKTIRPE